MGYNAPNKEKLEKQIEEFKEKNKSNALIAGTGSFFMVGVAGELSVTINWPDGQRMSFSGQMGGLGAGGGTCAVAGTFSSKPNNGESMGFQILSLQSTVGGIEVLFTEGPDAKGMISGVAAGVSGFLAMGSGKWTYA